MGSGRRARTLVESGSGPRGPTTLQRKRTIRAVLWLHRAKKEFTDRNSSVRGRTSAALNRRPLGLGLTAGAPPRGALHSGGGGVFWLLFFVGGGVALFLGVSPGFSF